MMMKRLNYKELKDTSIRAHILFLSVGALLGTIFANYL